MTTYLVTIREVKTFQIEVKAETDELAQEAAIDLLLSDAKDDVFDLIDDEATVEDVEEMDDF